MAIAITKENFEQEVLTSTVPVLVDFWAPWCGPCRMIAPTIDELSKEAEGFKVCKINVDDNQELAVEYGVMSIPTLMVFKNGSVVNQSAGVKKKDAILEMLK